MSLSKSQRAAVRAMFGDCCAYCGHPLPEKWHADHVKPIGRRLQYVRDDNGLVVVNGRIKTKLMGFDAPENDILENYFPACVPCNIDKGMEPLEMWRKHLERKIGIALRGSTPLRHAQRFGLVQFSDAPIVFHFEKFRETPHDDK